MPIQIGVTLKNQINISCYKDSQALTSTLIYNKCMTPPRHWHVILNGNLLPYVWSNSKQYILFCGVQANFIGNPCNLERIFFTGKEVTHKKTRISFALTYHLIHYTHHHMMSVNALHEFSLHLTF